MEKCIVDLYSAVAQIDRRYFNDIGTRANQTQYQQNTENPFSAELYHRFKTITELPLNLYYYNNLILQFDITKASVDMRPDLVLHEAQANRNIQKMFIEVKTNPNVNLEDDFQKLITATEEYLHFDNAVIIVINRPFTNTKQLISNYFRNIDFDTRKKMFLINVEIQENMDIDYNLFQFTSIRMN